MDIYEDSVGRIYVGDQIPRLSQLSPAGPADRPRRPCYNTPHGVWGAPDGAIFIAEMNPSQVVKLTPQAREYNPHGCVCRHGGPRVLADVIAGLERALALHCARVSSSAPTILHELLRVVSAVRFSVTLRPRCMTIRRSATANTSGSVCVIRMTGTP